MTYQEELNALKNRIPIFSPSLRFRMDGSAQKEYLDDLNMLVTMAQSLLKPDGDDDVLRTILLCLDDSLSPEVFEISHHRGIAKSKPLSENAKNLSPAEIAFNRFANKISNGAS